MSKFDAYAHLSISLNPDGTLTRGLNFPKIKANTDAAASDRVVFKDVTLNVETKIWARLFLPTTLPSNDNSVARLPIIIYFHHGGWILLGADDATSHRDCSDIASGIPAVVVSVNYRLAPENRLPEQYHDGIDAIRWVQNQATNPEGEQWLRDYGDFSRCYLYGCESGGNIVFFSALYACGMQLEPLQIAGIILNQPMFGGVQRTESELLYATDEIAPLPVFDLLWELALPKGVGRNHRYCNPIQPGPHTEFLSRIGKCLVIGFGEAALIDRQQDFVTMLVAHGARVQANFADFGFHVINFVDPRRASEIVSLVKDFIVGL